MRRGGFLSALAVIGVTVGIYFASEPQAIPPHVVSSASPTPVDTWRPPKLAYSPNPFTVQTCVSDPCSPTVDPSSLPMLAALMEGSFGLGRIQEAEPETNGYGDADTFPFYFGQSTDPQYNVVCTYYGGCTGFLPAEINIPNGAQASIDSDHHASVLDPTLSVEYEFWEFNNGSTAPVSGGGTVDTFYAGVCTLAAFSGGGTCGGGVAAGVPEEPGLLDPNEWLTGSINHVVFVAVNCGSTNYEWPASGSDNGNCSNTGPPDGSRIWLDLTDTQINSLGAHKWEKTLLHEMHHYGLMVVDKGGAVPWDFYGVDNITYTLLGHPRPWDRFFTEVIKEGDAGILNFGANASHMVLSTVGVAQSNIHILAPCVNTQSC
jgi:hypothetical protein